jgi:hypothetical protein
VISAIAVVAAVALSLLITRIGAMALMLTGVSEELARFQARSAFTGTGFTTSESEVVLSHPVRRRIVMMLMILGNAGIITVVATLVVTFAQSGQAGDWLIRAAILTGGLVALWLLSLSRFVERTLASTIAWGLKKWTSVDARDYAHILHLSQDYGVVELAVETQHWLADRTLAEMRLRSEGVLVLGVQRQEGQYLGTPDGETRILAGDTLILYGRRNVLAGLDQRAHTAAGDLEHERVVQEQRRVKSEEKARDAGNERTTDSQLVVLRPLSTVLRLIRRFRELRQR